MKARTRNGGEKGRHLWPRLLQNKTDEGKASSELRPRWHCQALSSPTYVIILIGDRLFYNLQYLEMRDGLNRGKITEKQTK